jgi:hypothetical protein
MEKKMRGWPLQNMQQQLGLGMLFCQKGKKRLKFSFEKKYFIHRKNAVNKLYFRRKVFLIWLNTFINTKIGQISVGKMPVRQITD